LVTPIEQSTTATSAVALAEIVCEPAVPSTVTVFVTT
jgi:hypothetical protein